MKTNKQIYWTARTLWETKQFGCDPHSQERIYEMQWAYKLALHELLDKLGIKVSKQLLKK